jgi:hypothetical protein
MSKFKLPIKDDRFTHLRSAVETAVLALLVVCKWPELRKDVATSFSTAGFFVALYGIIFTITEVLRTKSAAELAVHAARETAQRIEALYIARDATECLSLIEGALSHLSDFGHISPAVLVRINKLYSAEFLTGGLPASSPHRTRLSILTSFASVPKGTIQRAAAAHVKKLVTALMEMNSELSMINARRLNQETSI